MMRLPLHPPKAHFAQESKAMRIGKFFETLHLGLISAMILWGISSGLGAQQEVEVPPEHAAQMKAGMELFRTQVEKILRERCLECHGGSKLEGEFDLSSRETLLASGLLDLKDVAGSHLLAVIRHDSEPHMPKDGEKLSDAELNAIQKWLELGAAYSQPLVEVNSGTTVKPSVISEEERQFWAYRPLTPTAPPALNRFPASAQTWAQTPIDSFILQKLTDLNILPNAMTDRRRLIRRAYFDLLGFPPSPAEVDAFLADTDPLAYEKLLDRLLQSPQYGERWARHWMDIARFAESHGYEQDYDRPTAYHYRDFLIRALNEDVPYNDFIRWQIAGDELEPHNPLAVMGTGFLGGGAFPTQLTEAEFETSRYDELDDMVNTLGTSVLGLSIGCARCHSHKFDPIPVGDYYRLAANFSMAIRSEMELDLAPQQSAEWKAEYEQRLQVAENKVRDYEQNQLPAAIGRWLEKWNPADPETLGPWRGGGIRQIDSSGGTKFVQQADGSWFAEGNAPAKDTYTVVCQIPAGQWKSLRLECLADKRLPNQGPGRAGNGNFALGDIFIQLARGNGDVQKITFAKAVATHQQNGDTLSVAASIDNDSISGWAVDQGGIGKDQAAIFELATPLTLTEATDLQVVMVLNHSNPQHSPGKIRLSWSSLGDLPAAVGKEEVDAAVQTALANLKQHWNTDSADYATAKNWVKTQVAEYRTLTDEVEKIRKQGPKSAKQKVLVTTEGLPHMPHHADDRGFPHFYPVTYELIRGDVQQRKGEAQPGYLRILMRNGKTEDHWKLQPPDGWTRTSFRRAGLANWITDVEDGAGNLAARVIVNRIWQHHFGKGLVDTSSDFGKQGDIPTHPELLEWLATDLVQNGWKLKRIHKLLMTSAVYMQASEADADFDTTTQDAEIAWIKDRVGVDRENKFLWKFPVRRLEAEAVRDTMLSVSGDLDLTQFGPGTLDSNMKRRSVYFFIKRSQLIPMMVLFDWPEHQVGIGKRSVTTIAPQALAFMNSDQARRYAAGLAKRVGDIGDREKVMAAYKIAFGRNPLEHEIEIGERFIQEQTKIYQAQGNREANATAVVDFCQAVMSMNELIYVD
jgi:mono/diheme cytochrome c family protein